MGRTLGALGALLISAAAAQAAPVDGAGGNVTPTYFNGSGVANGGFTGVRENGIELGLRGRLRYDENGDPTNDIDYDGDHTYYVESGNAPNGLSIFNWDWSVNVNYDGSTGWSLSDLVYEMVIDFDPSSAVGGPGISNFDPFRILPCIDHEFGDNGTPANGGAKVDCSSGTAGADYLTALQTNTVGQNSWNQGHFGAVPGDGIYTITLSAFTPITSFVAGPNFELAATTSIDIVVGKLAPIPLPAGLPLLAAGLGSLALLRRRR